MPFANNDGIRIHYEVAGTNGPPLVLHHGLTSSLEDWKRDGYVERIESEFQLVLIDGRGHGKSDKLYEPEAYKFSTRATDVVSVLDDLAIDRAHFWGVSMGAGIGYGLVSRAPERIDSLVLGAGHPFELTTPSPIREILAKGPSAFLDMVTTARAAVGNEIPKERRDEILAMDTKAVSAATQYPNEEDSLVSALREFDRPTLLYAGEHDHFYDHIERVPALNSLIEFKTLPGLDHPGSWADVNAVAPIVMDFLKRSS